MTRAAYLQQLRAAIQAAPDQNRCDQLQLQLQDFAEQGVETATALLAELAARRVDLPEMAAVASVDVYEPAPYVIKEAPEGAGGPGAEGTGAELAVGVGAVAAQKPAAEQKLDLLAQCLELVASCHDGDELRTTVIEELRPMVAGSNALTDKVARELSSRYVSLTGAKGTWTTRTISKVLREVPRTAMPSSGVELTHVGVAQEILRKHDGDLRTVVEQSRNSWLRWEGCRWTNLSDKQVGALAAEHIDALKADALSDPALDSKEYRAVVQTLGNSSFCTGVVTALAHQREAHVSEGELNAHRDYLAVANGAVELSSGELVVERELLLTIENKVAFNPDAQCPRFLQALTDTFEGREDDIAYYEAIMGYTLQADPAERAMFFHKGEGTNGKSLLLSAIARALGGHAVSVTFKLLATEPGANVGGDPNSASPAVYSLRSKRLAVVEEFPAGGVLRDQAVKELAGGGNMIQARNLNQGMVEFPMTAAMHILLNGMPTIRGGQQSTWNRVYPVVYTRQFEEAGPNSNLAAELAKESEGILAWLVRCSEKYRALKASGKRLRDVMPQRAWDELNALKTQQDPLAEWLADCCVVGAREGMHSLNGFTSFMKYMEPRGGCVSIRTQRAWTERMKQVKGLVYSDGNLVVHGVRGRGFKGVSLKPAFHAGEPLVFGPKREKKADGSYEVVEG